MPGTGVFLRTPSLFHLLQSLRSTHHIRPHGAREHLPPREDMHGGPHTCGKREPAEGRAAVRRVLGGGWRLSVLDLYHTLRTPAKAVITLLSQNGFWP